MTDFYAGKQTNLTNSNNYLQRKSISLLIWYYKLKHKSKLSVL